MDLLTLIAAIIIAWLVFTWLIKVIKISVNIALTIALLVLILQLLFGIGPEQIWQQLREIVQNLAKLWKN